MDRGLIRRSRERGPRTGGGRASTASKHERDAEARVGPTDAENERRRFREMVTPAEEDDRFDGDVVRAGSARHAAAEGILAVVVAEVLVHDRETWFAEN